MALYVFDWRKSNIFIWVGVCCFILRSEVLNSNWSEVWFWSFGLRYFMASGIVNRKKTRSQFFAAEASILHLDRFFPRDKLASCWYHCEAPEYHFKHLINIIKSIFEKIITKNQVKKQNKDNSSKKSLNHYVLRREPGISFESESFAKVLNNWMFFLLRWVIMFFASISQIIFWHLKTIYSLTSLRNADVRRRNTNPVEVGMYELV